jgi:hypothetical protein
MRAGRRGSQCVWAVLVLLLLAGMCSHHAAAHTARHTCSPSSRLAPSVKRRAAASASMNCGWLLSGVWYVRNADAAMTPDDSPAMPAFSRARARDSCLWLVCLACVCGSALCG